jgi:small-conductance mechanosensitive channel
MSRVYCREGREFTVSVSRDDILVQKGRTSAALCAMLAALLVFASAALAQIPGIPSLSPPKVETPPKTDAGETTEQRLARVRKLLDETRERSDQSPPAVPPGILPRETSEWRDAQLKLAVAYDIQLRALDGLQRARATRKDAEARERDWTGFDAPPPYSILRVDELREAADVARDRVSLIEAGIAQLKLDAERAQADLRRAEEDLRRAEENLTSASAPEDNARATWRRDLARLKARAAGAAATAASLLTEFRSDELAARRAELRLLERQIVVASQDAKFAESDLAAARKRLDDKVTELRRELVGVESTAGQRLRERDASKAALTRVQDNPTATEAQRAAADARADAAEAWVGASRDQADALRGMIVLGEEGSALWTARYTALHGSDAEARRIASEKLREFAQRVARWRAYAESLVRESRSRLGEVEARLSEAGPSPDVVRYQQDELAARRAALLGNERLHSALDGASRQLDRWVGDVGAVRAQRDLRTRLVDAWLVLRDTLQRIWNFEIFSVEDTTVSDGQTITISRGVTVGKSVGAFLVFLLGYWAIAAIARRIEKRVVAQGFDAPRVRTTKRWVLALSAFVLAVLTLNLAHIPFTVFAFLGGALAIGVGFGTQTIIKNFISGMLVLMERQVQVGDIVQVDNVTGTVTEVNLRSSTVRGFDGVETIVPNSALLENKVTNWTHSDRKVRRVVKVGVAYGSPVREVGDILLESAKRHGLVLAEPAPLVIFEDFGDNAMVFALYFWVDLGPTVNSQQVMSDLRFMIEKRFGESGIVIAFPQRDVRLDASKPLRVEVVPPAPIPGTGGEK